MEIGDTMESGEIFLGRLVISDGTLLVVSGIPPMSTKKAKELSDKLRVLIEDEFVLMKVEN